MKDFVKLQNRGKFHQYSIYGCQVKNYQSFVYQISIHAGPIFAGVFGALLLQIWSVFAQICSRASILADKNSV